MPETYEEWLALTPEQQHHVHFKEWNAQSRRGIAFAFTAAARLMFASPVNILDIRVGNYHGGEYLLEPTVSNDDYRQCPPALQQTFEGFRVYWHPVSYEFKATDAAKFIGTWTCENRQTDAEFTISVVENRFTIVGRFLSTNEPLQIDAIEFDGHSLQFEATEPASGGTLHRFVPVEPNRCGNASITPSVWKRATNASAD